MFNPKSLLRPQRTRNDSREYLRPLTLRTGIESPRKDYTSATLSSMSTDPRRRTPIVKKVKREHDSELPDAKRTKLWEALSSDGIRPFGTIFDRLDDIGAKEATELYRLLKLASDRSGRSAKPSAAQAEIFAQDVFHGWNSSMEAAVPLPLNEIPLPESVSVELSDPQVGYYDRSTSRSENHSSVDVAFCLATTTSHSSF